MYMNDGNQDDTHIKLVKAFMKYSKNNEEFELEGFKASSVRARSALLEIQRLIKIRRKEIFDKKIEMHGHDRKGIEPTKPSVRRARKIQRQIQKQQAEDQDTDT
jgi:hypothetical protein